MLRGHLTGFHFLISVLKPSKDFLFLISAVICSQIFDLKYDADSVRLRIIHLVCMQNFPKN